MTIMYMSVCNYIITDIKIPLVIYAILPLIIKYHYFIFIRVLFINNVSIKVHV